MDKKTWMKPEISVVEFEANEYVSACGNPISGSGYLLISITADRDLPLVDSSNSNQIDTLEVSNFPQRNTADYLEFIHSTGQFYDEQNREERFPDQILAFGTNDYVWDDGCWVEGHAHNASTSGYDGWYAPQADNGYANVAADAWTRVKIWFQEVTSGSPIHAAPLASAHSA